MDIQILALNEGFDKIIDWLDFDGKLNPPEMATLRSSFEAIVQNTIVRMSVSNGEKIVIAENLGVVCIDVPETHREQHKQRCSECMTSKFNREGFFLQNIIEDPNPQSRFYRESYFGMTFLEAPSDKRFEVR
jgi:hypothetical protein